MIPKIIHYCWFGGNPLDDMAKKCIASWKKFCPDYEIKEWNESNFDINSCAYVKEAYQNKKWAFVSDYARFWILYNYGGVYFDTDVEVIKSLDDILSNGPFMACEKDGKSDLEDGDILVAPGLGIAALPGMKIYREIMDYYKNIHFISPDGTLNETTIVIYITEILKNKGLKNISQIQKIADMTIYPKEYFCPKESSTCEIRITPNTVCIHHYGGSWIEPYISFIIGKKSNFVKKYGVELGSKKYEIWKKCHKLDLYIRYYGFKTTMSRIFRKILKIMGVYKDGQE